MAHVVPGKIVFEPVVREVSHDDPDAWMTLPSGERVFVGRKLADVVAEHGWSVPLIAGPGNDPVSLAVSLESFRGRDAENTWLAVGYREKPMDRRQFGTPEGPVAP